MTTLAEALAPKSDQLNADDLIPGPRTLKVTGARISSEDRQKRIVLNYEGDQGKPFKPCKTMGRAMVMVWAVTDEAQLVGKSIRVYRDPAVRFGDQGEVGGIRISHMSHIDKPVSMKLTVSQGKKAVFTFHPLVTEQPPASNARAKAEAWLATYEQQCREAATPEELAEIHRKADSAVAKLAREYPDLHERALALRPAEDAFGDAAPMGEG